MYSAGHKGLHLTLHHADGPSGPWHLHPTPILPLAGLPMCTGHVASPDVVIEEASRSLRLYFHCPTRQKGLRPQWTHQATSVDGVRFATVHAPPIPTFYFRRFEFEGRHYAIAKELDEGGALWTASDRAASRWTRLPGLLPLMRHAAVLVRHGRAILWYTSMGDAPEHIKYGELRLAEAQAGGSWVPTGAAALAYPATTAEGAGLPISRSNFGVAETPE